MTFEQMYLHAETYSRRIAVAAAAANVIWRWKNPNDDSIPDVEWLDDYLSDFIEKETLIRALVEHRKIESETMMARARGMSLQLTVLNPRIEKKLKEAVL
jgi:hypothetical protein